MVSERTHALGLYWLMSAGLLALPLGCSTCGPDGSAVPFKRDEAKSAAAKPAVVTKDAGAELASGEPVPGVAYDEPKTSIELEGVALKLEEGAIRAALPYETDGDKVTLLVTQSATGVLALERSALHDGAWTVPKRVALLEASARDGTTCSAKAIGLLALGASYALVDAELACDAAPATAPKAATDPPMPSDSDLAVPPAKGGGHAERCFWIVSREGEPRVLQHIDTATAQSADAPHVEPALQSRDLDGDGRSDLVLALNVSVDDKPPTRIELKLFDRAAGLAPSGDEPEKTLLELAEQAKNERKHNPNAALELAQRALDVHAALCRESATSSLRIGGRGLDCGPSLGAGRALSLVIAMLAAQGKTLKALSLYQSLDERAYRLTDNDRERARVALQALVDRSALTYREGPQLKASSSMRARRSAIAFLDEGHLLLRGIPARSYDLASGETEATGIAADTAIVSPDGRFAINAIIRGCDGYHASIGRAGQALAGVMGGPTVSEPLIVGADPPPGARCPALSAEQRRDDGGLHAIDWTAQGILFARDQTLLLLALDGGAAAGQPARTLSGSDAPPTRAYSDRLTADGRYLALPTPLGIAVYDRSRGSTRLLGAPEGTAPISDVALSPSGRTVALVRGRQVYIGRAPEPSAPANPP